MDVCQWRVSIGLWYCHLHTSSRSPPNTKDSPITHRLRTIIQSRTSSGEGDESANMAILDPGVLLDKPVGNRSNDKSLQYMLYQCPVKMELHCVLIVLMLLMLLSGDIELNPGPKTDQLVPNSLGKRRSTRKIPIHALPLKQSKLSSDSDDQSTASSLGKHKSTRRQSVPRKSINLSVTDEVLSDASSYVNQCPHQPLPNDTSNDNYVYAQMTQLAEVAIIEENTLNSTSLSNIPVTDKPTNTYSQKLRALTTFYGKKIIASCKPTNICDDEDVEYLQAYTCNGGSELYVKSSLLNLTSHNKYVQVMGFSSDEVKTDGVILPLDSFYEVAAQGLWGDDFIFPKGTSLISGVYHISISSSSQLNKAVTIHLEHCVNIVHQGQAQYLSFVIADSDKPPYQFRLEPGGTFKEYSKYGIMSIKSSVSIVAIVKKVDVTTDEILNSNYRVHVFSKYIHSLKKLKISLLVVQDLKYFSQIINCQKGHQFGKEEISYHFQFAPCKIQLYEDKNKENEYMKLLKLSNMLESEETINSWKIGLSGSTNTITETDVINFSQFDVGLPLISFMIQPDPTASDFNSKLKYSLIIDGTDNGSMDIPMNVSFEDISFNEDNAIAIKFDKVMNFDYLISFTGKIHNTHTVLNESNDIDKLLNQDNDILIAEKKLVQIKGSYSDLIDWERYGLRIEVSEGTLSPSETAELAIVVLVGGNFEFPEGTQLASAVYALSVSKPLLKPLKLAMQHCVNLVKPSHTKYLQFVYAPIDKQPELPYKFNQIVEGEFTIGDSCFYGSTCIFHHKELSCVICITTNNFTENKLSPDDKSLPTGKGKNPLSTNKKKTFKTSNKQNTPKSLMKKTTATSATHASCDDDDDGDDDKVIDSEKSITNVKTSYDSPELKYIGILYYVFEKDLVMFTASKRINALQEYFKKKHPTATKGSYTFFKFKPNSKCIKLVFNKGQDYRCPGWIVRPIKRPHELLKEDIDRFGTCSKQTTIPITFDISVYSVNSPRIEPVLDYGIQLKGIEPCGTTLYIHRQLIRRTGAMASNLVQPLLTDDEEILSRQPDLYDVLDMLSSISDKWQHIGIALRVDRHIINGLENDKSDDKLRLYKILNAWFDKNNSVTWKTIIDAVEGSIVNNKAVANNIQKFLSEQNNISS